MPSPPYTILSPENVTDLVRTESVSRTLECSFDDYCAALRAPKPGKTEDYAFFMKRAGYFRNLFDQETHSNEPSHHVAYLYNWLDRPEETQRLVRQITTDFYQNKPDGLIGNDDCGQMSAWYLFSAMGFYPVNPVSGELVFGAPQLPKVSITVGEGKTFIMEAKNLSAENMYVERIEWNGQPYDRNFITYDDIMGGGSLVFHMSDTPKQLQ